MSAAWILGKRDPPARLSQGYPKGDILMDQTTKDRRLAFLRRAIWWMPVLTFAVVAAVLNALNPLGAGGLVSNVTQGLIAAVVVGILVVAAYFGYKYMLDRGMNV